MSTTSLSTNESPEKEICRNGDEVNDKQANKPVTCRKD